MNGGGALGAAKNYTDSAILEAQTQGQLRLGNWNAATNTPAITQGTGTANTFYDVAVAGTWNGIYFNIGDQIKCNNSHQWERLPKGVESNGPIPVAYIDENTTAFPTQRASGTPLIKGDYVKVLPSAASHLPITIGGVKFDSIYDMAEYTGVASSLWIKSATGSATSQNVSISNKNLESVSKTSTTQAEVNKENVEELAKKEKLTNKTSNLDSVSEGDLDTYPNAKAVNDKLATKIENTRKVAGITLENDITIQQLIDAFKDVVRTYKNVTIDCDNNTLQNILVSCFKAGEVLSTMPDTFPTETYKVITAKAIYDFITSKVQGTIKIKGDKDTKAEIEALTDMEVNDEWYCKEDNHFWLYTESGWIDAGGGVDLSNYIKKSDIVNDLVTNDSQKPLSAAQGKVLKDLVDTKQDAISIVDYDTQVATLNPATYITLVNKKLKCMLGMSITNIEGNLVTPITDKANGYNTILKLPKLANDYSYPTKSRIQFSRPSGNYTCMANKDEFYNSTGSKYVAPTVANNKVFTVRTAVHIEGAKDSAGNLIYIAEQKKNTYNEYLVQDDGAPCITYQTVDYTIDGTTNPAVYVLKIAPGSGFIPVSEYYDASGTKHTGHYYQLNPVTVEVNKTYMYKCYLMRKMQSEVGVDFLVDENGKLCKYEINESEQSKEIRANEKVLNSFFVGLSGTITITPITFNSALDEDTFLFENHKVYDFDTKTHTSGLDANKPATGYYKATDTSQWYKDSVEITVNEVATLPTASSTTENNYYYDTTNSVLKLGTGTVDYVELKTAATNCISGVIVNKVF